MTPFTEVYDVFKSQFSDPIFNSLTYSNDLMKRYLFNAIPKFRRSKQNLRDRNDTTEVFNVTLTDEELLILGVLMVAEYLNPQIISLELVKQTMSTRDFIISSQAAHLKQLMDLRRMKQEEADRLIVAYTYNNADLSEL